MPHSHHVDGQRLVQQLRQWAHELGFSQIGIADIDLRDAEPGLRAWLDAGFHGGMGYMAAHGLKRARPAELVPGTVSVITARMDYLPQGTPEGWQAVEWQGLRHAQRAQVSLYARGRDYHKVLRQRLQALADRLRAEVGPFGHRAFTDSAPVLEVELAVRSGLGWRGKHTLALQRDGGSMFFLGELFVDLALPPTAPATEHCGQCTACIDICPTQAIVAPGRLDARRCISYLTIEHDGPIPPQWRAAIGNRIYGCDDCQRLAGLRRAPGSGQRHAAAAVGLGRSGLSAAHRRQCHPPHRLAALAAQPGGGPGQRLAGRRRPGRAAGAGGGTTGRRRPGGRAHRLGASGAADQPGVSSRRPSSASGRPAMPISVDTVTSPATNGPSPPMRTAST